MIRLERWIPRVSHQRGERAVTLSPFPLLRAVHLHPQFTDEETEAGGGYKKTCLKLHHNRLLGSKQHAHSTLHEVFQRLTQRDTVPFRRHHRDGSGAGDLQEGE